MNIHIAVIKLKAKKLTLHSKVVILTQVMSISHTKKHTIYFEGKNTSKKGSLCVNNKNSNLKLLHFEYVTLKPKEPVSRNFHHRETVLVLLKGKCLITVKGSKYVLGPRKDVFSGKSHTLYIPPNCAFFVYPIHSFSEIAIITAPAHYDGFSEIKRIPPRNVKMKRVGKNVYQRTVHTIINIKKVHDSHLMVGETFNEGGRWSSFPPHRHMKSNVPYETRYEEIYFFKVNPYNKFGFIRIYNEKKESVYCIKNNDCAVVTDGYHPVCAVPGSTVYYLWAMVGKYSKVINHYDNAFRDIS